MQSFSHKTTKVTDVCQANLQEKSDLIGIKKATSQENATSLEMAFKLTRKMQLH